MRAARIRAAAALLAWTAFLLVAVAALRAVGGPLAPPPLAHPGDLARWLDGRQPGEAAVAVLRLVTIGLAWYLLAVTLAGAAARLVGAASLVRVVDAVTLPSVRRLVHAALGVSLVAASVTGGGAAFAQAAPPGPEPGVTVPAPDDPPTMERLPDATTVAPAPHAAADAPTMERLPDLVDGPSKAPAAGEDGSSTTSEPPAADPPATEPPTTTTTTTTTTPPVTDAPLAPATTAPTTAPPAGRVSAHTARPPATRHPHHRAAPPPSGRSGPASTSGRWPSRYWPGRGGGRPPTTRSTTTGGRWWRPTAASCAIPPTRICSSRARCSPCPPRRHRRAEADRPTSTRW